MRRGFVLFFLECSLFLRAEEQSQLQLVEREDTDDEEDLFEAIDKLISQGINAGDVKKLQDAGIYTCNGLMMHTKKSLTGIKGLSEAKVEKICEAAEKIVNFGYITGSDALLRLPANMRGGNGKAAYIDTEGAFHADRILPIAERFGIDPGAVLDNIIYASSTYYLVWQQKCLKNHSDFCDS